MSAASTTMSVRPRRPASVRAVWTAPAARIDGIGSRSTDKRRVADDEDLDARFRGRRPRPGPARRARRPARRAPAAAGQVASSVRTRAPRSRSASRSPARSATIGPLQPERPRSARRAAEQRRPATQLDPQVHDDPLALRVDGRVGDLRERLAQVVGDRPVEAAATGRRRVVAHAPQRLVRLERHRLDVEPGSLGVEARQVAAGVVERRSVLDRERGGVGRVLVERSWLVVDRQVAQHPGLGVGVLEDRPPARLDQQQLARPEAAAADRLGRREGHGAGLRRHGDEPVAVHREGRRSQAVAVDQRADAPSVAEHDGGRPVPWREHPGRPATQRRDVRVRRATQGERLRDRGEQGRREVPAGRRQQLQPLVERQRIGAVRREQRAGGESARRRSAERRGRERDRGPARDCRGPC